MQKKKVRTAVIGAGKMGAIHAKVYDQLEQSDFIAVVDIDADKARPLAEQYNCSAFSDYTDIIGKVDAVTIATPTVTHLNLAKKFIKNNIAVLIEKPLAVNVTEGRKIAAMGEVHYQELALHYTGSPVSTAAMLHLNLSVPNCAVQEHAPFASWMNEVVPNSLTTEDGYLLRPDGPGLGIDLNEDRIPAHPYSPSEPPHWRREDGSIQDW